VILFSTTVVQAQQPPEVGPIGGAIVFAVERNAALREELQLTEEQVSKLREVLRPIQTKRRELAKRWASAEMTLEQYREMQQETTKLIDEASKMLEEWLQPKQLGRLRQIGYQDSSAKAFEEKKVQAALKLTDGQKTKLKPILDELDKSNWQLQQAALKEIKEILATGGREKIPEKVKELRDKRQTLSTTATEKILKELTDAQKKTWTELQGEKFDLTKLYPGGR
jgi:hypothetical protein